MSINNSREEPSDLIPIKARCNIHEPWDDKPIEWIRNWSYSTPLEAPPPYSLDSVINTQFYKFPFFGPEPHTDAPLNARVITINGVPFQARRDCNYKHNYYKAFDRVQLSKTFSKKKAEANPGINETNIYRRLMLDDLWFFVYFAMGNALANHPFIVEACREIEDEEGDSEEVWARDHLKTTIITVARQCQKVLANRERRVAVMSATRGLSVKILDTIKTLLERQFLKDKFPDVLYQDPYKEARKWSLAPDSGLFVKREGLYKEPSFGAFGLFEGMPTGDHYTDIVFDDIVTPDFQSPDSMQKICDNIDLVESIGTRDRQITTIGTFYRHDDPLMYVKGKINPETGAPLFKFRKKPATIDGTLNGRSVFLPEAALARKRAGRIFIFYCQQLLNPTPRGTEKLNKEHFIKVSRGQLPERLLKFMIIDGAGEKARKMDGGKADAWAFLVIGVEPYRNAEGLNRIYLLDAVIKEMDLTTAQETAVKVYCRNGRIVKLGIEKVGMSTTEIHICAALKAKKRFVGLEYGNLEILKPSSRSKEFRIESNLALPLKHGCVHYLDTVDKEAIETIKDEMEKFPATQRDDGIDGMSYIYDMIKNHKFSEFPVEEPEESDYDRAFRRAKERQTKGGWQAA